MPCDDFITDGKPDACSAIFGTAFVKFFFHMRQLIFRDTITVIPKGDVDKLFIFPKRNVDLIALAMFVLLLIGGY